METEPVDYVNFLSAFCYEDVQRSGEGVIGVNGGCGCVGVGSGASGDGEGRDAKGSGGVNGGTVVLVA